MGKSVYQGEVTRLTLLALAVLLMVEGARVCAQTVDPVPIGDQPCVVDVAPGRPTLKRRPPKADSDEGRVALKIAEREKCSTQDSTAESPDSQKSIRIEFEGLSAFTKDDMLTFFREQRIGLPQTRMQSSEVLGKIVATIKQLLKTRGYFHATVDTREDIEGGAIAFLVSEGKRLPLAEVRFEGNKNFSSQDLESRIKGYLAYYERAEDGYDADLFEFALRRLLNFVRSRGYLQATFGEPTREIDARGLVLTVAVDEGVVYRLGEVRIKGAEVIAPARIREMLDSRQGDVANGERLGKWLYEDLKKVYGELGFIEYTAEIEPEFKVATKTANEGVVDLIVNVEEGRRFRVRTIRFQGSGLTDEELLRLMRIRAGDVFNDRLFEESIRELNKLGLFEPIDKDKDTDFNTDQEEGLVDIVIKLNALNSGAESGQAHLNRR